MSVRLDDGTELGEVFFFKLLFVPIKGMNEMSVRLDDGTNLGEAFFLLASVRPD